MRKLSLILVLTVVVIVLISATGSSDNPHGKDFNLSCNLCHSSESWKLDRKIYAFDHDKTNLPLTGRHTELDCRSCHPTLVFSDAQPDCFSCHTDLHGQTVGQECDRCHSTRSWVVENITDIHRKSRFPLVGPHYTADCQDCHKSASLLRFDPVGVNCFDCHQQDYTNAKHPDHVAGNFSQDCIRCHSMGSFTWVTGKIDHSFFPLTLGHKIDDCSRCHTNGNFSGLSPVCSSCHLDDYNSSLNPSHTAANIPQSCNDCHTTNPGWKPATFAIHNNYWEITGAHAAFANDCNRCHNGSYSNTPNTCVGCHQEQYNNTTDPNHVNAQFGTDCQTCHSQSAWKPATFDHDGAFFPIYSGKHKDTWTLCSECHTNSGNYQQFSCIDCHEHNQQDMDDKHGSVGGYIYSSPACYACHPTGSSEGSFNHNSSVFPLTGAHTTTPCSECHASGYPNTPVVCSACHINVYNQTTNPNHVQTGIANTCETCHTTAPGWKPASFPTHGTYYQLTGAHATIANNCSQCHNGNYNNTPNTCAGCHQNNYNQTNNPPHSSIGISTDCQTCHNTNPGWNPAQMPTHNNYWALTGAHVSVSCDNCHNGNYNSTPNTCYGCHQNDYTQTTNPPHASAQFPTACETCHTTTTWVPSTFDHDGQYFPIYSGKHNGKWNLCSDCHFNPSNYQIFTCLTCHLQPETDQQHQGIPGYVYTSPACYSCHPTGSTLSKSLRIQRNNDQN